MALQKGQLTFSTVLPWGPHSLFSFVYWVHSSGIKRLRREANSSTVSSAETKNAWIYISTPSYMAWCSVKHQRQRDACPIEVHRRAYRWLLEVFGVIHMSTSILLVLMKYFLPICKMTSGTHCTGGWVGLRAGLDTQASGKILCLYRRSNLGLPVCSQTLH
jgi:hypothetical protein